MEISKFRSCNGFKAWHSWAMLDEGDGGLDKSNLLGGRGLHCDSEGLMGI